MKLTKKKTIATTNKVTINKKKPKLFKTKKKQIKILTKGKDIEEELLSSDSEHEGFEETKNSINSDKIKHSKIEAANSDDSESDEELQCETAGGDEFEKHKSSLQKLKNTDPEFYKFLEENDRKLLQFGVSDDELSNSDVEQGEEDEDEQDEEAKLHKLPENLEVASDDSDFEGEDEEEKRDSHKITLKMLKSWQAHIQTDKSNKTIITLTAAFHAALRTVTANDEDNDELSMYKVEGSSIFNAVVQLCVLELGPAVRRFLGLKPGSKQPPHKCKKFVKVKNALKGYFTDLLKLLTGVTSSNIQTVLLKHLHYMSLMLVSFPNISKSMVKHLITIWGTADDNVRVIAFFCILRITNNQQVSLLDTVLKSMYMTYVKNSKFVSVNTLASINFMRRSLVEMFSLDVNVAYQHVFLYIRQLAIHLRNAITVNKKENVQSVYNWQFVNSLKLWANLLSVTVNKPQLQQLVYPFVQVCLGTLKLVPTAQYYPLRFNVVQMLVEFSRDTGVFVPVLPFILEVLNTYDFNKKHQKVSMKPINFTCLLKLSKSQLSENGFKDAVIESVYGLLLEYLSNMSHTIGFPDLTLICVTQLKQFVKKCSNANYNRKIKQILEKIEQTSQLIESERSKLNISITDFKKIEAWETQIKNRGTPINTFFESWHKMHKIKKSKQLTNNEALGDYNLPVIKKHQKKSISEKEDGPVELFPSDSEDEDTSIEKKKRRGKRGGKNVRKKIKVVDDNVENNDGLQNNETDIVKDFDVSDW